MAPRRTAGFTLLEAVVALFLLFTTIVVSFSVVAQVRKAMHLSWSTSQAAFVARDVLNQERAVPYTQLVPTPGVTPSPVSGAYTLRGVRDGQAFTQEMLYAATYALPTADTLQITVTVSWQDVGATRRLALETIVGSR